MSGAPGKDKLPGEVLPKDEEEEMPSLRYDAGFAYKWSAGVAVGRFLQGLREGKILGRECRECSRILVPPRMFCEDCFRTTDRWVEVGDRGTVKTYSVSYVSTEATRLDEPIYVAVIELTHASEGMGFLHKLDNVEREELEIGLPVKARWKARDERTGSITDIRFFEPAD